MVLENLICILPLSAATLPNSLFSAILYIHQAAPKNTVNTEVVIPPSLYGRLVHTKRNQKKPYRKIRFYKV
jgi:hypothetical protein